MAEVKFKIGDKVQIRESSDYYGDSKANPMNVPGKITRMDNKDIDEWGEEYDDDDKENHRIRVDWDNGQWNNYRLSDLEPSNLPFYG